MINIVNKTKNNDLKKYYRLIDEYYYKALKVLKKEDKYDLSIILVGPISIKRINRDYRNIDKVTDVISFALLDTYDGYESPTEEVELGDIFININRVQSQAKEYGHSQKREFVFLFVHGLLHLFGYDHMNEKDEKVMFSLQKKIIGDLK